MNLYKYILLLVLSFTLVNISNAQKSKPINSGFVFIDGVYIEPPYKVKQKEPGKIYINGIYVLNKIRGLDTILNPYEIKELTPIPKEITRNTSFKELTELRHGEFSYLSAVSNYYYTHFPQKEADKKMYEYLMTIPCIKSIEKGTFEFYNGDKKHMSIGPFMIKGFYERFGIHSKRKLPTKKEIRKREEQNTVSIIIRRLNRNKMFCFNTKPIKNYSYSFNETQIINGVRKTKNKKPTYIDIREEIKRLWGDYELEYSPNIEKRIKEIRERYIKEGKLKTDTFKPKIDNKTGYRKSIRTGATSYSPSLKIFNSFCSADWHADAFSNFDDSQENIFDYISGSDFDEGVVYQDITANDDVSGTLDYGDIKNLGNSGVLLGATHGRPPNDPNPTHLHDDGIFLWFATSEDAIKQWAGNDPLVIPSFLEISPDEWNNSIPLWGAFVHTDCSELLNCAFCQKQLSYTFNDFALYKVNLIIDNIFYDEPTYEYYGQSYKYNNSTYSYVHSIECIEVAESNNTTIFSNAIKNKPYFSSGNFNITDNINNYLNNNDMILTACNKIEMYDGFDTGTSGLFIAQTKGSGEIFSSCNNVNKNDYDNNLILTNNYCNVYPNPFNEELNIELLLEIEGNIKIELYNIQGQIIGTFLNEYINKEDLRKIFSFNMLNLTNGIYFCKITQDSELIETFKIIKNK